MKSSLLALIAGFAISTFAIAPPVVADKGCADTNKDSAINAIDAARILQVTADLFDPGLVYLHMWDANDDASIDAIDAAFVLQFDAGLIKVVPVCATPAPTPTQLPI